MDRCPICGSNNRKREQKLVDLIFRIALMAHAREFGDTSREALAEVITDHLKQIGFATRPQGMSWGVLE